MSNLLTQINDKTEKLTAPNLIKLGILIFIIFVPIGLLLGNFMSMSLNIPETNDATSLNNNIGNSAEKFYEGIITYVNPRTYPKDNISFVLKDEEGNDVILLKSDDQKLAVTEGHKAKVYGSLTKSSDEGNNILIVSKVVFRNVTKEYEPGFKALDDVTLSIDDGEFIFLVGPSGAGKSTFIKMLIREETPSEGEVLFNEVPIAELPSSKLPDLRRKIGVVFQDFKLLNSKNVFENVAVALEVVDSSEEVVKMFNFPKQLSGGEKQRLSIARALAHEPDVLVADEPTGMIDPKSTEEVVEILERINSLGTTILMASHDQNIVNKLKKRVVRIEEGKIMTDKKGGRYYGQIMAKLLG